MSSNSTFYSSLSYDDDSPKREIINPAPPPRRHKDSLTAGPEPSATRHLDEIILKHRQLVEALMNIEGIEDDSVTNTNRDPSTSRRSPSVANLIQKEESFLCRSGDDIIDSANDASSISSENDAAFENDEKITWRQRLLAALMENYAELMDALSETNEDRAKIVEPTRRLNAIELRHNVKRCIVQSKPYMDTMAGVYDIFIWFNPLSTLFMFWVYLYCVYKGYVITVFLGLILLQLIFNYLHYCRKISLGLNLLPRKETNFVKLDLAGAQLIIEVSRKVQILLDYLADFMEKIKNLFIWKLPRTTWRFSFLVTYWFILSLILSTSWFLTILGFGIGGKLFLTTYLFHRFPRLRHKFDVIIWFMDRLPTDRAMRMNHANDESSTKFYMSSPTNAYKQGSDQVNPNSSVHEIHDKKIVRKCALLDNEKSFPFNVGSGTLQISKSQVIFKYHRFNAGTREIICVNFDEILSINKAKALKLTNFGEGMSIEIYVAGRQKPYIFAGMLRRDECFDALCAFGRDYNAPWAR